MNPQYYYNAPQSFLSPTSNMYTYIPHLNMNISHVMASPSEFKTPDANIAARVSQEELHANYVTLYVTGLSNIERDQELFTFFTDANINVIAVKVCRDFHSKESRGFGYANFYNYQDATTAMEKLDYTVCNIGKPIRLAWCIRDLEVRKNGIGKLFLKNLAPSIGEKKLYEIFSQCGKILSVKVARRADRSSLKYGHVHFATQEMAETAIKTFNDTVVSGMKLLVTHYVKRSDRKGYRQDEFNNLFVKNIDMEINETLFRLKFSEFGPILSAKIATDENGNPKGFGFVCFEKPENARTAMEKMHGIQFGNKTVYVGKAMKKAERAQFLLERARERKMKTKDSNLYVKYLNETVDNTALYEHFSQCGTITSAKVMYKENGVSKGFGFVCYSSPDEAKQAIATLNGKNFRGKPLYVQIAESKEERRENMMQFFANRPNMAPATYPQNIYCAGSPYTAYNQAYVAQPLYTAQPAYRTMAGTSWPLAGHAYLQHAASSSSGSGVTISPVESLNESRILKEMTKSSAPNSTQNDMRRGIN